MAVHPLTSQFLDAHSRLSLGDRRRIAIAAHFEVRSVLRASPRLLGLGLRDVLIGSYARKVSIWPGKDVDVFGRLMEHTTDTLHPATAHAAFEDSLSHYAQQGRLTKQPRSLKVAFGPSHPPSVQAIRAAADERAWTRLETNRLVRDRTLLFDFSVDVVPAVLDPPHYGIPDLDHRPGGLRQLSGGWKRTDPVALTELAQQLNRALRVGGVGALVRVVKTIKQVKEHHLGGLKPGGLYYEFILHEGFGSGGISGDTWAEITASALEYLASRLGTAAWNPICDPVLGASYEPQPPPDMLAHARRTFGDLARKAQRAITISDRCQAAIEWRAVFGENGRRPQLHVFPLPAGCRADGVLMGAAATNTSTGGTQERSFGTR